MKRLLLLAVLAPALAAGCASKPLQQEDHWNARSISPRVGRVLTGYDPDRDGSYLDYQWEQKRDVSLMFKRHFMNWNPENPFHAPDESMYKPRPLNSPFPRPQHYFLPDLGAHSIIATFSPGGGDEFFNGNAETFRPLGSVISVAVPEREGENDEEFSDLNPNVPIGRKN